MSVAPRRPKRRPRNKRDWSLIEFISDRALLGPFFDGPSWDLWRAVLKAATAAPMTAHDLELFAKVSGGRKPPTKPVHELDICVGRGGGKDAVASAIGCHSAVTGDFSRLRPGERGTVMVMANDRDQAGVAYGFTAAYFERVPLLAAMVESETADTIDLSNGARLVIGTNNTRAPRGRTICCAIYDECAFWRSDDSASPDADVDAAVSPGLMRFPGSIKILISSVNKRSGLLYERWAEFFGKDSDEVLVVLGTSLDFNPTLDRATIERDLARDPERYGAEYLSLWRDDLSNPFDRGLIDAATDHGIVGRPPAPGITYVASCDASGGRGDSFTAAVAHADEDGRALLDLIFERRAPFNPEETVAEIAGLFRDYRCAEVVGDNYAAAWVSDSFEKHGVRYRKAERNRSEVYAEALPLFTAGRVRLLDHPRLAHQFASLERRTARSGKDAINHPSGGQDDVANSAALALVETATEVASSLIPAASIRASISPPEADDFKLVQSVYATLWVDVSGMAAWSIIAYSPHQPCPLVVVDFDRCPWGINLPEKIVKQLGAIAKGMREGDTKRFQFGIPVVFFVQSQIQRSATQAMLQLVESAIHADGLNHLRQVEVINAAWLADPVQLAFAASEHWTAGRVRLSRQASEKSRSLPIVGALQMRPGTRIDDDALRVAMFLAIVLGLEPDPAPHGHQAFPGARVSAA